MRIPAVLVMLLVIVACGEEHSLDPAPLEFGASSEEVRASIEGKATVANETDIQGKHLPSARTGQSQMILEDFEFLGKCRQVKLVFSDDRLDMIWVDIDEAEEEEMIDTYRSKYGQPSHSVQTTTAWIEEGVAIINTPPQILLISENLRETYGKFLDQVSKQEEERAREE